MELKDITLELSVQANLDGQDVKVMVNGEDTGVKAKHIFKKIWFETGKIIGYSILQFYGIKDGFLVDKEGNQIHFSTERFPDIKVNRIKIPVFFAGLDVTKEWIRDTGTLMNLEKIEETVKDLSSEDKKALKDAREVLYAELETKKKEEEAAEAQRIAEEEAKAAEEAQKLAEEEETKKNIAAAKKAEEDAKKAEEEAKEAEIAAEKARQEEEEAKEQAKKSEAIAKQKAEEEAARKAEEEKQYVVSEKDYERFKKRSKNFGMEVYSKGEYHFFYGKNLPKSEVPFILKKRPKDYLTLEGGIADENEDVVEFEFTEEDGKEKILTLDLETSDVTIE